MENPEFSELTSVLNESELVSIIKNRVQLENESAFNFKDLKTSENPDDMFLQIKLERIQKLCNEINRDNFNNEKCDEKQKDKSNQKSKFIVNFNHIRAFASSQGGFMTPEARRTFYSYILNVKYKNKQSNYIAYNDKDEKVFLTGKENSFDNEKENVITSLVLDEKSNSSNFSIVKIQEKTKNHSLIKHDYTNIIKLDTLRSKLNSLFPIDKYHSTNTLMKQKLHKVVGILSDIAFNRYHYCQGYHDVVLLFFMLFDLEERVTIEVTQRFTEFYMRESLNSKKDHLLLDFNKESKVVDALLFLYDKKLAEEIISLFTEGLFFILPWIITFFTHCLNGLEKQYRILDYIICSCPNTIYYLAAVVVVEEYKKIKRIIIESSLNKEEVNIDDYTLTPDDVKSGILFMHFQKINYENFDFDEVISKCERFKLDLLKKSNTQISKIVSFYPIDAFK